ncbi:hypothetical protein K501DRAFT_202571, partial [Backusella circina FSU 941]
VDWTQPWLVILLSFHLLCFIVSISLRHHHTAISVYFFVLLGFAASTQSLNKLGGQYWELFSTEPYFDKSGLFIVITYSFPVIFNAFVTLFLIFKATIYLMIETKRAQLRQKKSQ